MAVAETDDVLLATLASTAEAPSADEQQSAVESKPAGGGQPLSAVLETLGDGERRLSQQVELVAAIDELIEAELIERTHTDEGVVLALTEAGADRAREVRERLVDTSIELVEGDSRRELTLGAAADELDRSLAELAAECSDEHVYHSGDGPPDDRVAGREREQAAWEELLERARDRRGGELALLAGPGGIGKTTLLSAFLDAAERADLTVARARCHGTGSEPYQPIRALLDQLPGDEQPFATTGLEVDDVDTFEAQQTALFHDITDAFAPDAEAGGMTEGESRDEAVRVIALDDLHLAEPATLSYLDYCFEQLSELPLVVLGSYRSAELPENAPVTPETVPEATPVTRFPLSELNQDRTRGVVERALGRRGVPEDLLAAIHERTGGNPLFVELIVEHLLETNQLDPDFEWYPAEPDAIEMPDEVRETIRQRVDALGRDARELLGWAAVAGESVSVSVLRRVCEDSEGGLATRLSVLVDAELFDWGEDRRRVTFTSDVVREALLAEFDDETRTRRHAAIAAALEATTADEHEADDGSGADESDADRAATIAHHHERGGNADAAIEWYRQAAGRAAAVYAHESAIKYTHRALDLARSVDRTAALLAVGTELAEQYLTIGEYDEAKRFVRFVRGRTPETETKRRQRLARLAAAIATARGDYETAAEEAEAGVALGDEPTVERCRLLDVQTDAERQRGNYEAAREFAEQQRALAEEIDDDELEAQALLQLGSIAERAGEYDDAERYLERALERYQDVGERRGIAEARRHLGTVAQLQQNLDEAETHHRRAITEYEAAGERHGVASARVQHGIVTAMGGDQDEGEEILQQAREELRAVGDRHDLALVHNSLGIIAWQRGRYENARAEYRAALEKYRTIGDQHSVAMVRDNLGGTAEAQGRYEEAREHYQQALEGYQAVDNRHQAAQTRNKLGLVDARQGAYDRARERASAALSVCREIDQCAQVGSALYTLGVTDRRRGAYDRAAKHLQEAIEKLHDADDEHSALQPRIELGALTRERDDHETAESLLRQALDTATEFDDRHRIANCREQLGALARERQRLERADDLLDQASEGFRAVDDRHGLARIELRRGRLARDRGAFERARDRLDEARERFETLGAHHWTGRTQHAFGTVAATADDPETARDHWERALECYTEIGAIADALETLSELVEAARDADDRAALIRYCERACTLLDEHDVAASGPDRDWFERHGQHADADRDDGE